MAKAQALADLPQTVEEFHAWHEQQPEVWEFIDGQPRLMAPGSKNHTIIKTNIGGLLQAALIGRECTVFVDGAQVVSEATVAIPDVVVTCAPLDYTTPIVAEPTIIIEVMSPSSAADDTGRKWFAYRHIASLRYYLVVSQDRREVLVHSRADQLWHERFVTEGNLVLDNPSVTLAIDALYDKTDIPA